MNPQELANLAHLRRARDLIDREYARPLDVPTMARHALPDESFGFYRDALGLEVHNDVASGGFRWVTLGSPDQPGLGIVLSAATTVD